MKFREGFVKNRYIGRTFIMPGQAARKKSVRQKLNAIELEFRGKNVMLVDDSIVRGTTCKQIIQMAREAGAKNVYFCSAAPAVRYPNVYGIDMPSAHELIAHNRSTEDVSKLIGADWLVYQDLPDLIDAVGGGKIKIDHFDCAVFDGEYVTGDVNEAYLNRIEQARNDATKAKSRRSARSSICTTTDKGESGMTQDWDAGRLDSDLEGAAFDTLAVRAGQRRTPEGEHGEALFTTSSYVFRTAADAAARFAGEVPGNVYSRYTNPRYAPSRSASPPSKEPSRRWPRRRACRRSSPW